MSGSTPLTRHIASLFAFCNSDLTYDCVRQQCLSAGWRLDEEDHDNLVLRIHIDDALSEMVASLADGQQFGRTLYLPLFCTEDTYDCITDAPVTNKPSFDAAFSRGVDLFRGELGDSDHSGTYRYFNETYQYAMWRGERGVLVLLQDDFDIQFGSEITAWVIECPADQPIPELPPHA